MTGNDARELARRFIDGVWNGGALQLLEKLYHPDPASDSAGPRRMRQSVTGFREAFPDLRVTVEREISAGNEIAILWRATGSQLGPLVGISRADLMTDEAMGENHLRQLADQPPTGRHVSFQGITLLRTAGGRIVSHELVVDRLEILLQLGLLPLLP